MDLITVNALFRLCHENLYIAIPGSLNPDERMPHMTSVEADNLASDVRQPLAGRGLFEFGERDHERAGADDDRRPGRVGHAGHDRTADGEWQGCRFRSSASQGIPLLQEEEEEEEGSTGYR
jgi:hypothetical protein